MDRSAGRHQSVRSVGNEGLTADSKHTGKQTNADCTTSTLICLTNPHLVCVLCSVLMTTVAFRSPMDRADWFNRPGYIVLEQRLL